MSDPIQGNVLDLNHCFFFLILVSLVTDKTQLPKCVASIPSLILSVTNPIKSMAMFCVENF